MSISRAALGALLPAALLASCSAAADRASNSNGLLAALETAKPGMTIALPAGTYAANVINGRHFSPAVTIASADPNHPAILSDLKLTASSGIHFRDLTFSTAGDPIGPLGPEATTPFQVVESQNIRFVRIRVHGDPNGTLASDESGMLVRGSSDVTVEDSDFSHLHDAFAQVDDDHLTFTGNRCQDLRDKCFRGGGTNFLTVTWNRGEALHPDGKADSEHPDFIQIWGMPQEGANQAHDILIAHNLYRRGEGTQTQGIFVQTEARWRIPPLRNVRVTSNIILGAQYNGIYVEGVAPGTEVDHNIVRGHDDMPSYIAVRGATGVNLHDNVAQFYNIELKSTSDIRQQGDRIAGAAGRDEEALAAKWEAEERAAEAEIDGDR